MSLTYAQKYYAKKKAALLQKKMRISESNKKYYLAHKEECLERTRAWRASHPKQYKALNHAAYLRRKATLKKSLLCK